MRIVARFPRSLIPATRDLRQHDGYIPDLAALFDERYQVRNWEPVSYAWPQRVMPAVVALVHNHAGRVLLLQREGEIWDVPQGSVGPGETVEEAVRREVAMRTGLQVRVRRLSGVYSEPEIQVRSLPSGEVVQQIVNCFVCDVVETQHEPPVETSLLFADPSHLPEPLSAYVRRWLADALNGEVVIC